MSAEDQRQMNSPEEMDSASRRDFMKVAGVSALGLAYIHPVIETMHRHRGDDPQGGSDPAGGAGNKDYSSSYSSSSSSSSWRRRRRRR